MSCRKIKSVTCGKTSQHVERRLEDLVLDHYSKQKSVYKKWSAGYCTQLPFSTLLECIGGKLGLEHRRWTINQLDGKFTFSLSRKDTGKTRTCLFRLTTQQTRDISLQNVTQVYYIVTYLITALLLRIPIPLSKP